MDMSPKTNEITLRFNPYFLDQPIHIFVNGGKFFNQYV